LEIVAATFTIEYWNDGNGAKINNNAWVALFLVLIVSRFLGPCSPFSVH